MNAIKDWWTTIPGLLLLLLIVGGATWAMGHGLCTFGDWWEKMITIFGSAGGGALVAYRRTPGPNYTGPKAPPAPTE